MGSGEAAANLVKHGISFDEGSKVFADALAQVLPEPGRSPGEDRAIMMGQSDRRQLLVVVFTEREERIRIIGARVATQRERRDMKNTRRKRAEPPPDDMPAEYKLDWSKAKPNPYAARLRGRTVAVVLEPDVAEAFPSSESVNTLLRSVLAAIPRRASFKRAPNRKVQARRAG